MTTNVEPEGREYLIKRPLAYKMVERDIVSLGSSAAKNRVTLMFAQKTPKDCQGCSQAVYRSERNPLDYSERFSLSCRATVCQRAGWTRSGPLVKTEAEKEAEALREIEAVKAMIEREREREMERLRKETEFARKEAAVEMLKKYGGQKIEKAWFDEVATFENEAVCLDPSSDDDIRRALLGDEATSKDIPRTEGAGSW